MTLEFYSTVFDLLLWESPARPACKFMRQLYSISTPPTVDHAWQVHML